MTDFLTEDFEHTAALLRCGNDAVVRATLSNNRNIILAALDLAAAIEPPPRCDCPQWLEPHCMRGQCARRAAQ